MRFIPDKTIVQKLLIKPGNRVMFINPLLGYQAKIGDFPEGAVIVEEPGASVDMIQLFATNKLELEK